MREYRTAVLLAEIRSLAIQLRWIMHMPEGFDKCFIIYLCRIECDPDDLGMAGLVGAYVFIRGIFGVSVAVASLGICDAGNHAELGLHAPEAAGSKRGDF